MAIVPQGPESRSQASVFDGDLSVSEQSREFDEPVPHQLLMHEFTYLAELNACPGLFLARIQNLRGCKTAEHLPERAADLDGHPERHFLLLIRAQLVIAQHSVPGGEIMKEAQPKTSRGLRMRLHLLQKFLRHVEVSGAKRSRGAVCQELIAPDMHPGRMGNLQTIAHGLQTGLVGTAQHVVHGLDVAQRRLGERRHLRGARQFPNGLNDRHGFRKVARVEKSGRDHYFD